jgi:uncharacterized protein with GYD domain
MAVYVTLYRYTDEGMKHIKEAGRIARGWQQEAEKAGIKVLGLYWLQGDYDAVTIIESDNDDAVNSLILSIGAQGYLRTQTMRAMSLEDVERAVKSVR